MSDIFFDIIERANLTNYKIGDLIAPCVPAPFVITQANMRLSLVNGLAFIDSCEAGRLTPYLDHKIEVMDSLGKKAVGYIKAAGTGETLDTELVQNGTGWTQTVTAMAMVGTTLFCAITGLGIYQYAGGVWSCITAAVPSLMSGGSYLFAVFEAGSGVAEGLWYYNTSSGTWYHPGSVTGTPALISAYQSRCYYHTHGQGIRFYDVSDGSDHMIDYEAPNNECTALVAGEHVHASYAGLGTYIWVTGTTWTWTTTKYVSSQKLLATWSTYAMAQFDDGAYEWNGSSWTFVASGTLGAEFIYCNGACYGQFAGYGIYRHESGTTWTNITTSDSVYMAGAGSSTVLYGWFSDRNMWVWDGSSWTQVYMRTMPPGYWLNRSITGHDVYELESGALRMTTIDSAAVLQQAHSVTTGALYKCVSDLKNSNLGYYIGRGLGTGPNNPDWINLIQQTEAGTAFVTHTDYRVMPQDMIYDLVFNNGTGGNQYGWIDNISLKKVLTPSATGVTIVSTRGGSTYNWTSIESGFNYNDSSGYTVTITEGVHVYKCTTAGQSASSQPEFNMGAGATTTDGGVIWTECNPSGIVYEGPMTFLTQPKYGDIVRHKKYAQPVSYSSGGDVYSYDKGLVARESRRITWERMLSEDLDRLLDFIGLVRGAQYNFSFSDEDGDDRSVKLLNADEVASTPTDAGYEGNITMELFFI